MDLLTIGEFARLVRLTPKALRHYDELGLLTPARVDAATGYRFYDPAQVDAARLVAWLRRLGMPLATIRTVCALEPAAAAAEVRAFWATVEAETAVRRELADAVAEHLSRVTRTGPAAPVDLRYAVLTDRGLVRPRNQDAVHAGDGLLAVADGFGDHGGPASSAVIDAVVPVMVEARTSPGNVLNVLHDAVLAANAAVAAAGPPGGGGSTLTAMVRADRELVLVHIGDSRAYVLRDGELLLVTHDHTYVQVLVDEGRLAPDEARSHPQRALLLRALDGRSRPLPDVHRFEARPGDRWLLCSDGLSTVLDGDEIRHTVAAAPDPEAAVTSLVARVHEAGAPHNVSCVVADVVALP